MNIIIVGCGKVGQKIAEKLCLEKDNNLTVVDVNRNAVRETTNAYDVIGYVGDCVITETLLDAGVKNADLLIAVTGSDEINLLTCLIAKKLGGCQTIARVRKPEYNDGIGLIKDDLGLAMVINPSQIAAREIARLLRFPSAVQIDTFAKGRVELLKFRIPERSVLDDLKISRIQSELGCDILVCGVERGDKAFIPNGDFILREGDLVSIVAAPSKGGEFFRRIGIKTNRVKDTIIVGGGDISYYLAKRLFQSGIKVKIIEKNPDKCQMLSEMLPKAEIVCGDGTDNKLLLEEGISKAESFVSLINIDEENILLSLFAKSQMESGKIITKINRIAYDEVISKLDLDTIIYPKNTTAEYIIRFVRAMKNSMGSNVETMHLILDGKAEALEFNIDENSPVAGIPIGQLNFKKNVLIACINHNGEIVTPRGNTIMEKGDTVIVVTSITGLNDIKDILE